MIYTVGLCWAKSLHSILYEVAQKYLAQFLYAVTLSNIDRFSKLFHCRNQEKISSNTVTKDPITPQVYCYTTLSLSGTNCRSVSLITPLISGVVVLNASSSSNVDILNIWCKNCRIWQLLHTITETNNTLFPVINLVKCTAIEVVLFSICF